MRYNGEKRRKVFAGIQIIKDDRILLGMKKRGTGTGLWQHAFAGKVEKNETVIDAAIRELHEETGLTASREHLTQIGFFEYEFSNPSLVPFVMEVHIYRASEWNGYPKTSSEIRPKWFDVSDIPFFNMWPDNQHWLEKSLKGEPIYGYFVYEDWKTISEYHLEPLGQHNGS